MECDVGEMYRDQAIFPVVVVGETEACDTDLATLNDLMIDTPSGAQVPLSRASRVPDDRARTQRDRSAKERHANYRRDLQRRRPRLGRRGQRHRSGRARQNRVPRPAITPSSWASTPKRRRRVNRLLLLSTRSASSRSRSFSTSTLKVGDLVLLILMALPLALASGGVLGVFAGGGIISLGSLVGFVTVLGIAARNAIMLISHYRHLAEEEPGISARELILRGAEERLAPILMTALTTGLSPRTIDLHRRTPWAKKSNTPWPLSFSPVWPEPRR